MADAALDWASIFFCEKDKPKAHSRPKRSACAQMARPACCGATAEFFVAVEMLTGIGQAGLIKIFNKLRLLALEDATPCCGMT